MNKRRLQRAVLILGVVCLLIVGAYGVWLRSERRQEALNRQLIAALVKRDNDRALSLVNQGADPNTPYKAPPPPSLRRLWNRLVHGTPLLRNDTPSAFTIACGEAWDDGTALFPPPGVDAPLLVEAMLLHGAQKNAKDSHGYPVFINSTVLKYQKTMDVLLKHRVDVNAQDQRGCTALYFVVGFSVRSEDPSIVRKLLAHGANPNLPNNDGMTPLRFAQKYRSPELAALLEQTGAKK